MRSVRLALAGALLLVGLGAASAGTGRAGSTAGNALLRGTPGARAAGMGGAYTALAEGPLALHYNAAGLDALDRNRLLFQYDNSFLDINRSDAVFARPVSGGGLALGVTVIDYGTMIQTTTVNKTNAGSFSASDLLVRAGYGRPAGARLSLGGTLGYYRMEIADEVADGVTADVGALYRSPWSGLTLGAAVRNIGTRARFMLDEEELPLTLVLGASYRPTNQLLLVLEYEVARNQDGAIRAGAEYQLVSMLALRVGYNGSNETDNGLTLGAGFTFNDIQLDYAYVPFGDLGQSHRVSAEVAFGAPAARKERHAAEPAPHISESPNRAIVAAPPPDVIDRPVPPPLPAVAVRPVPPPALEEAPPEVAPPLAPARPEPPRQVVAASSRPQPTLAELKARAKAAISAGRPADAVADYRAALAMTPSDTLLRYNLATALYLAGRFSEAASEYREVVSATPRDEEAWLYLGLAELKAGRTGEGRSAIRRALDINPRNEYARQTLEK